MKHIIFRVGHRPRGGAPGREREDRLFPVLLGLFLAGAFAGCASGLFLNAAGAAVGAGGRDFWEALWSGVQFFLLLGLMSTSYLGMFFAPAAALLRGYLLSCSVAAQYAAGSWTGLLRAALTAGVPALLLIPCFLIAARDAVCASRRLWALRFGGGAQPRGGGLPLRLGAAAALSLLSALYSHFLLPELMSGLLPH